MSSTTGNERWTTLELDLNNGCPSHTLKTPLRRPSTNDLMSNQFDSSINSGMSGITCNSFGISIVQQQPSPSMSKDNLLRYRNMVESSGSSTTNQSNSIWISLPTLSSLNSSNNNNSKKKMKKTKSASSSSSSRLADNQRRWLATSANEKALDRPIGMIKRNSSSCLFPVGSPVSAKKTEEVTNIIII